MEHDMRPNQYRRAALMSATDVTTSKTPGGGYAVLATSMPRSAAELAPDLSKYLLIARPNPKPFLSRSLTPLSNFAPPRVHAPCPEWSSALATNPTISYVCERSSAITILTRPANPFHARGH